MGRSARDFQAVVWPMVSSLLGGGELVPVESVTANQFAAQLDQIAGIDAWIVQKDSYMFGLGSRVQWVKRPFNTFTVRMRRPNGVPTEYEKRKAQIATSGALYPKWMCHAYLAEANSCFLTAAVALTEDVIDAVDRKVGRKRTAYDGVEFWEVKWREMWQGGCKSLRYVGPEGVWPQQAVAS